MRIKKFLLSMDEETHTKIKALAANLKTNMNALINEQLEKFILRIETEKQN